MIWNDQFMWAFQHFWDWKSILLSQDHSIRSPFTWQFPINENPAHWSEIEFPAWMLNHPERLCIWVAYDRACALCIISLICFLLCEQLCLSLFFSCPCPHNLNSALQEHGRATRVWSFADIHSWKLHGKHFVHLQLQTVDLVDSLI
jgi:hypothetical protein